MRFIYNCAWPPDPPPGPAAVVARRQTKMMKTKQLANVLIKILGLSVVVHGLPSVLSGLFGILQVPRGASGNYWYYPVASVVTLLLGICLIIQSREVAAYLFKGEDE
jgi:hypothetical protein